MRFLNKLFKLEEINGGNLCPTYLYRWLLLTTRWFNVYLHKFVADDWSRDLHDHPRRFISIGLCGSYIEDTPNGSRKYSAPWIRTFPPEHIHRLRLIDGKACWTLVIVAKPSTRDWGFWHKGVFIHWRKYVGSEAAKTMKSCE